MSRVTPWLVAGFWVISVAPVWAGDYGSANDVVAIRTAVQKSVPSGAGPCAVHANDIVIVDSYALVNTFFGDPCGGAGDEQLWAKRNGAWSQVLAGKPGVTPCQMKSIAISRTLILQLINHFHGPATAAQAQRELKNCQR